jgi:hypothetical protein
MPKGMSLAQFCDLVGEATKNKTAIKKACIFMENELRKIGGIRSLFAQCFFAKITYLHYFSNLKPHTLGVVYSIPKHIYPFLKIARLGSKCGNFAP